MDPVTMAIIAAIAGSIQGTGSIMSERGKRKDKKKELEEMEKKRKSDFASQQMDRTQAANIDARKGMRESAQNRAQVLQGIAQNINLGARRG